MNADSSMLRDRLGYRMFREMGVAAPRAVHARVQINGKSEGLYIAVEQIDGVFTRSRFTEGGEGNLYKEIWPLHDGAPVYAAALETNEDQGNVQHMLDFRAAVQESGAAAERFYKRDYMMRYLAVDRVTVNDDGAVRMLCTKTAELTGNNPGPYGNHNYYWYEELQSGRMWLIPWDLDKSFDATSDVRIFPEWTASAACSCTEHPFYGSQIPAACDPVIKHFQSALSDYERAVDAFVAGPFAKEHVDTLIAGWVKQIRSHVAETAGQNGAPSVDQWETAVDDLRRIVEDARKNRGFKY
jgi:spore coat protein H